MSRLFRFVLRLYPEAYRECFGEEMLEVFTEGWLEAARRGRSARLRFLYRELLGSLSGVLIERISSLLESGFPGIVCLRRITMRSNLKFPLSAIVFMLLSLLVSLYAMTQARAVSESLPDINPVLTMQPVHVPLPGGILVMLAIAYVVGIAGWASVFAMRRSGVQRLSRTETWFGAK